MFFEVHRGLVGLGAMTIYRTAAETAADIETFGKDTGAMATQGGLLTQQRVMKYAASQGRLQALQQEVGTLENRLQGLQGDVGAKVRALEKLGVAGAGDYVKMAAKMTVSYAIPLFGWLSAISTFGKMVGIDLSFLDVDMFGGKKKKQQQVTQLIQELDALMKQMAYWADRRNRLRTEGEALADAVKGGEKAIDVQLISTPQHLDVKEVYTDVKDASGFVRGIIHETRKKIITTPESKAYGQTIFKTADELAARVALQPSGDRLPVGFQTIYSPVLDKGKIVAKVPQVQTALPGPVERRVVYNGLLSGVEEGPMDTPNLIISGLLVVGILAYFVLDVKSK